MKKALFVLFIFSQYLLVCGQSWSGIGHFNGSASLMAVDSVNDVLYIAGNFNRIDNNLNVQGVCRYDGVNFTNVHSSANLNSFSNQFFTIQAMAFYNGELYIASNQIRQYGFMENFPVNTLIMKYTGSEWVSVFPEFTTCFSMKVENDNLFIFGLANAGTNYTQFMGVYNGEELNIVPFVPLYPQFNGLYFGNIYDVLAIDSGYVLAGQMLQGFSWTGIYSMHVFFWDGVSPELSFFNDGIATANASNPEVHIRSLAMFNEKVHIGGYITSSMNCTGWGVVYAENDYWHSLSGNPYSGFLPWVNKLLVHEEKLWVVGELYHYNATLEDPFYPLSDIAIWDGVELYRPSDDTFQSPAAINDIVVFRDTVYVAGSFEFINVTSVTSVARFTGIPTNLPNREPTEFRVFPNPSTHTVYLSSPDIIPGSFVRIYNLSGQLVYEQNVLEQSERLAITTNHIGPPGMYVVQLRSPGKSMAVQKLVVAE